MLQFPENQDTFSLQLSEALEEIGVNMDMVLMRRKADLLIESLANITFKLTDIITTPYFFGSQIEGTTTRGLKSDKDNLLSINMFTVIQDWNDWESGVINLLMVQDDNVSPGYCLLQLLRYDAPLPLEINEGAERSGPAHTLQGVPGASDSDFVTAFTCKSWPVEARHWLSMQGGGWPKDNTKTFCENTKCFVVGIGSKNSNMEELEWRISTSEAERCLMFSLNITQIRCYILMKMILKTYISSRFENALSSYMCKTVLFHCISHTPAHTWSENNLLTCLNFCLTELYNCVLVGECPHFIIPENNLMFRRIAPDTKPLILEKLRSVIDSNGKAFIEIQYDSLGAILYNKFSGIDARISKEPILEISAGLLMEVARNVSVMFKYILSQADEHFNLLSVIHLIKRIIRQLIYIYNSSHGLGKTACSLLAPRLCATLGSVLASFNISHNNDITSEILNWLSIGLNADVSSSKLKEASIYFCTGDSEATDSVLRETELQYDLRVVEPFCDCTPFTHVLKRPFCIQSLQQNYQLIQRITAADVIFHPCEIYCCPKELKYEMFRSTSVDKSYRGQKDGWMDWAVVDSLPYLYFLQYKNFDSLGQYGHKQRALAKLSSTIDNERNLGHRETALNLLGQCMEEENRVNEAFQCYIRSRNIRERNNAANWHIFRLLATMINSS